MTLLLLYLALAIGVSFICSVLEAVLLSVTPTYVETILSEKPAKAKHLSTVKTRLDDSLASILILNTFAHTMGAAGVGSQALQVFGPQWETVTAILLTLIILYFSEIIPKTLGAKFWRELSLPAAAVIIWLTRAVFPLVWISTCLTRLLGNTNHNEITREEIIALASLGHKGGVLGSQENDYLTNVLNLRDVVTEQILTPRTVVHMLPANSSVTEALNNTLTRQFTRIPVYDEDQDHIVGKVIRADLFQAERDGLGEHAIEEFARPVKCVLEKMPVRQLLDLFIRQKAHMLIVVDEFGQTVGVVTLEDAIETLLGREIVDESDTVEDMQELAREQYRERLRKTQEGRSEGSK
ncbi:MAG: CBS domain containing-hemolysin-like protein [Lentisphaeria bacterium]|jgi:CBS domain containing-hemolysin-like protein